MSKFAIIGMAGRFPEADTPDELFENLLKGKSSFRPLTTEEIENSPYSRDNNFVPITSTLKNVYGFDNELFKMSGSEAKITDPQQRIFLKCCYEALEDSSEINSNKRIGVFGSSAQSSYLISNIFASRGIDNRFDYSTFIGNETDFNATRVSYKLNLNGPSLSIQSGCSSALVALNEACQNINCGTCYIALVGGVSITFPLASGYSYNEGSTFSKSGQLRPFDESADGMIKGDGCGVIVIKPYDEALKDQNNIYAVISGVGISNDGNSKVGYTAPSIRGEKEAILMAIKNSKINPEDISYIETHGTGTKIGDPIEARALFQSYNFKTPHQIGSVKANIGHLDTASGIVGLIKGALILKNSVIPKSIGFNSENPQANLKKYNLYVNSQENTNLATESKNYVAVSSFGIGGTNVHVILENDIFSSDYQSNKEKTYTVQISAKNEKSLDDYRYKLADYLEKNPDIELSDIARTLNMGRKHYKNRYNFVANSTKELRDKLISKDTTEMDPDHEYVGKFVKLPTYSFYEKNFSMIPKKKAIVSIDPKRRWNSLNEEKIIEELCSVWEQELDEIVSEDSDFFELNGDSLLGIGVIESINKTFNIDLGSDMLISYPTPKKLAKVIYERLKENTEVDTSNIHCLYKKGSGAKNLFLIHPAGGSIFCFKDLVHNITNSNVNIYAISFPKNIDSQLTISELADIYVKQIKKIQKDGHFLLGGYSFGGNVAIEIARKLEEDNKRVDKILMIDSLTPNAYSDDRPSRDSYLKIFPMAIHLMLTKSNDSGLDLAKEFKYLEGIDDIEKIIIKMKEQGDIHKNIDNHYLVNIFTVWENNHLALLSQSEKSVHTDITIFSADSDMPDIMYSSLKMNKTKSEEWANYSFGEVNVVRIPGNHFTCMSNPEKLSILAKKFEEILEDLEDNDFKK